jgi:hypothetical protein
MEEQQGNKKPFNHRRRGRGKFIHTIQNNAMNTKLPNGVKKELTYQQALSILLRSKQLIREGSYHPHSISQQAKAFQINECYKQRSLQRD